jgi:hypothetical protein
MQSDAAGKARGAMVRPPLQLETALHRAEVPGSPLPEHHQTYFSDLFATFGVEVDTRRFNAMHTSFTDLIEALLLDLPGCSGGFDLAVMASAVPDAEPGLPMCFLSEKVREAGLAFAICDQGVLGFFTALRLAADRARLSASRIWLFALDQDSVLHSAQIPRPLRCTGNSAAMLVFDAATDAAKIEVADPLPASPESAARHWQVLFRREQAAARLPFTAIIGHGLAAQGAQQLSAGEVIVVPPGRPASGIWAVVAAELGGWRATGRQVLLADYDSERNRLAHCLISVKPESARRTAAGMTVGTSMPCPSGYGVGAAGSGFLGHAW